MVFKRGDPSNSYFVIIKGSVSITVVKEEFGNVPVIIKTCYDGDYFGELAHFEGKEGQDSASLENLNMQRQTCIALEHSYILEINKAISSKIINTGMIG